MLFGVFASNYAPFLGPNMLQRGDYAPEICYFSVFLHPIMLRFWEVKYASKRRLCS